MTGGQGKSRDGDSAGLVDGLELDALREILKGAAEGHADVASSVRLAAERGTGDLGQLRAEIDRALRTRRFLGRRESSGWALQVGPVVNELRRTAAIAPSQAVVTLVERAIGHVVKTILQADDSDGMIGDVARDLLGIHCDLCALGVAEAVPLARWMAQFGLDNQDFFLIDPVEYRGALGELGLAAYRREVRRRLDAGNESFAVRHAEQRLAVLDGDVASLVALLGGDLTRPYQFIQVADAMAELGRDDDVLAWAIRGIKATRGWQVSTLYDLACGVHASRGALGEVLRLRRGQHEEMASSSTYVALQKAAEMAGGWDGERQWARSVLEGSDLGGLVDVLLSEGETEVALQVHVANPAWEAGDARLARLADALTTTGPGAAVELYWQVAESALTTTGRAAYLRAVSLLKRARSAAASAGESASFEERLGALRDQNRRRPTLIALLDKAGLT